LKLEVTWRRKGSDQGDRTLVVFGPDSVLAVLVANPSVA
jgi:hypothetical protein